MKKNFIIILSVCSFLTTSAQTKIDRTKKPAAGPAPVITIANPATFKLANGITVLVVENHKLPKISATYSIDMGPITEGKKAGVTDIMGQMLNEGTKKTSKATFDEAVDLIGADVNLSASGGSASALTRYFEKAFALMTEALQQPAFRAESFEKLKTQTLTGLKADEKNVKSIAGRVTNALTYGVTHPAGEFVTEASISGLSLNDVKAAYAKYITPSRGYLTFVGDITPTQAKNLAAKYLGAWKGKPLQLEQIAEVKNPAATEIDFVDAPNAQQAEINVVNLVNIPLSSPDYFPVILANYILGGGAESRLFMNLREKRGFTYGAYSSVGSGRFQSTFNASAAVRNEKVDSAIAEFLYEIEKIKTEKVTDEELASAKALYNGSFALGMENPARIAQYAVNIELNGLSKDFYRNYLTRINAVTKEDIQRVANKYFNDKNTRVIVVAKGAQVLPSLSRLNIPVKQYDKYAVPVAAQADNGTVPKTSAPLTVDAKTVVSEYLKAIGGAEVVANLKSISVEMETEMQGMKVLIQQKQMAPNMESSALLVAGNVMQRAVFNGSTGFNEQMGNKMDMTAEELAEKKSRKYVIEQAGYTDAGYKLQVTGTEKINGSNAYKVVITTPAGNTVTEYYDVATKLLLRSETTESANGISLSKTTDLSDYRKSGVIMFPYKQTTTLSAGGQEQSFSMTVKSVKVNEGVSAEDFK